MIVKKVCDLTSLKKGRATVFRVSGKQVAVYFDGKEIFAFSPFCPHARANLTKGTFQGHEVRCHWHGWRFNIKDGEGLNNDANLKTYPVTVQDGEIFVDFEEQQAEGNSIDNEDLFMSEIKWKE
ncbi:MAG: Rieske (2Fe-2S) protein [Acidobacteria bacterium]|nr:Rieske (2Fe-2S) protein [Acidobacteriota bacterium]